MTSSRPSLNHNSYRFYHRNSPEAEQLNLGGRMPSLECSAVRENPSGDQILGSSSVSWLERIEEENYRIDHHDYSELEACQYPQKQTNSMKFSFNKNDPEPQQSLTSEGRGTSDQEQTLKQIYYQQFQKQTGTIKSLQKERQILLNSITDKKKIKNNKENKENLFGSIRRGAKIDQNSKSTFEDKDKAMTTKEKLKDGKDQQEISLKYLQDSLAKKSSLKIPLSKMTYLQESKFAKEQTAFERIPVCQKFSNVKVRQFDETEEEMISFLQILFQELDKLKVGKLFSENCDYQSIREEFKIVFGYVLVRIVFKDLIVNKEQFVMLGLQVLKELNSNQINKMMKEIQRKTAGLTLRMNQTIRRNPSQDRFTRKSHYIADYERERSISSISPQIYLKEPVEFSHSVKRQEKDYSSVPVFKERTLKTNVQSYSRDDISKRYHQLQRCQPSSKLKEEEILASYRQNYQKLQRESQLYKEYLATFKNEQVRDISPSIHRKIRNISEEMILEHKRNLEYLTRLNDTIENYLSRSRRRLEDISQDRCFQNTQNTLVTDRFRNSEWMFPPL